MKQQYDFTSKFVFEISFEDILSFLNEHVKEGMAIIRCEEIQRDRTFRRIQIQYVRDNTSVIDSKTVVQQMVVRLSDYTISFSKDDSSGKLNTKWIKHLISAFGQEYIKAFEEEIQRRKMVITNQVSRDIARFKRSEKRKHEQLDEFLSSVLNS